MSMPQIAHNPAQVVAQVRREQLIRFAGIKCEDDLQIQCVKLFNAFYATTYPDAMLHHSPNGGSRHKMTGKNGQTFSLEAQKLKNMGVTPGWPDLEIVAPGVRRLYVELKYAKGSLSPAQRAVHDRLRKCGNTVVVCRTVEEFDLALQELFNEA